MIDMAMCLNEKCEKRFSCYRYMAEANERRQSYMKFDHKNCHDFWPISEGLRITAKGKK